MDVESRKIWQTSKLLHSYNGRLGRQQGGTDNVGSSGMGGGREASRCRLEFKKEKQEGLIGQDLEEGRTKISKPIMMDEPTMHRTRLAYARVLI